MTWEEIREPGCYLHLASGLLARIFAEEIDGEGPPHAVHGETKVATLRRVGLPVLRSVPVHACRRHYPGGTAGAVAHALQRRRPSP